MRLFLFLKFISLSITILRCCELTIGFISILSGDSDETGRQNQAASNLAMHLINNGDIPEINLTNKYNCSLKGVIHPCLATKESALESALELLIYDSNNKLNI